MICLFEQLLNFALAALKKFQNNGASMAPLRVKVYIIHPIAGTSHIIATVNTTPLLD